MIFGSSTIGGFAQGVSEKVAFGAVPEKHSSLWDRQLEVVVFEDIPLTEVVQYLRDQFDGLNFVLAEELQNVEPFLKLRRVSVSDILEGLSLATGGLVQHQKISDRLVHLFPDPGLQQRPELRAFNLRNYFETFGGEEEEALKELYQVLEQGWTMMRQLNRSGARGNKPELSIHQKTKLLIAVGYDSELRVVESIVDALHGGRSSIQSGGMGAAGGGYGGFFGGASSGGYGPGTSGVGRGAYGSEGGVEKRSRRGGFGYGGGGAGLDSRPSNGKAK